MESDMKWILVTVIVFLVSLFSAIAITSIHETNKMAEMVSDGADPMAVKCMMKR